MSRRRMLLDACVAINLAATGRLEHIADTLKITFLVATQVAAEAGNLRDVIDGELVLTPIDLHLYERSQAVEVLELAPPEFALYLELAAIVDDCEAATIAIAVHHGLDVATDDRKARRLSQERNLAEPLRTIALLHAYADATRLAGQQIRDIITNVRDRASFQPSRTDPDLKWWNDHL